MADKKPPSTRSLIADAETLRGDAGEPVDEKQLRTRQLVAASERLIGRERPRSARGLLVALAVGVALVAAAVILALRY